MKFLPIFCVFIVIALKSCSPQGLLNANRGNVHAGNRQGGVGGLSFAIPGLSLLAGNNGGGNLFAPATVTRTVVSTVSTVTTASFRTCVGATAALMPCAAGRRRRDAGENIEPTPAMEIIVGPTTIRDQEAVLEYLEAHKPCSQSVIYPPNLQPKEEPASKSKLQPIIETEEATPLYPSQDTPDTTESDVAFDDAEIFTSTETPGFDEEHFEDSQGTTELTNKDILDDNARGRLGLGKTSTVTTVIRVTSVATSLATGAMATLTVSYMGCLPPSLPISGPVCQ